MVPESHTASKIIKSMKPSLKDSLANTDGARTGARSHGKHWAFMSAGCVPSEPTVSWKYSNTAQPTTLWD